jgi:hypothetical protein
VYSNAEGVSSFSPGLNRDSGTTPGDSFGASTPKRVASIATDRRFNHGKMVEWLEQVTDDQYRK